MSMKTKENKNDAIYKEVKIGLAHAFPYKIHPGIIHFD